MPSQCSITGNLQTLLGVNAAAGKVVFLLINVNGLIPYVYGTTTMVLRQSVITADNNGNITGALWGNDNISPGGTQYQVTVPGCGTNVYNITGSSWNLNTAVPAVVPPPGPVLYSPYNPLSVVITGAPSGGGNFTLPHTLGRAPVGFAFQLTSLGIIVFQTPISFDASNLYLTASGDGITGNILIW